MKKGEFNDPFKKARIENGMHNIKDHEEEVIMILRHDDIKQCALNWKIFQSGATPGRIVVPSEEAIRETRQIPFEVDPPLHGAYRNLIEAWFRRPFNEDYKAQLNMQINALVDEMFDYDEVEVVSQFSLNLQSKALTLLLNTPVEESKTWIDWGVHVFRSEGNPLDASKANILYDYLDEQIEKAIKHPSEDLYSVLLSSEIEGRKLTKEEVKGVMILTFAGGRDTIINAVTNTIAYLAEHPESLIRISEEPKIIHKASEELIRYFSPLTHMGRVTTEGSEVCKHAIKNDQKVSLCWASGNRDEKVFEKPNEVILDRKRNPHVAFGFGPHNCLGAHHTRQILKTLLLSLANKVASIEIIEGEENIEEWGEIKRKVGFENLKVKFNPKN